MTDREKFETWTSEALRGRTLREPPAELVERAARRARRRSDGSRRAFWTVAALLALALPLGWLVLSPARQGALPPPPVETLTRGGFVALTAPTGELDAFPAAFDWEPHPEAASYRLRIFAVDDELLLERESAGAGWTPDAQARERLRQAVRYSWSVEALDRDGAPLAVSERAAFRIRP